MALGSRLSGELTLRRCILAVVTFAVVVVVLRPAAWNRAFFVAVAELNRGWSIVEIATNENQGRTIFALISALTLSVVVFLAKRDDVGKVLTCFVGTTAGSIVGFAFGVFLHPVYALAHNPWGHPVIDKLVVAVFGAVIGGLLASHATTRQRSSLRESPPSA